MILRKATIKTVFFLGLLTICSRSAVHGDYTDYKQAGGTYALYFDGEDDYVDLGNDSSLCFTGDMAISAWCKLGSGTSGRDMGIAGKIAWDGWGVFSGYALFRSPENLFCFFLGTGTGHCILGTDQTYTNTEWHHVVGTIRGGTARLYVDGALAESYSWGYNINDSGDSAFAGRECSNIDDWYFNGMIDEVRFYNRGLSDSEVTRVMSGELSTDPSLKGYWDFEEGYGRLVQDRSRNNNHGILKSAQGFSSAAKLPQWMDMSDPFLFREDWENAMTFDQAGDYLRVIDNHGSGNGSVSVRIAQSGNMFQDKTLQMSNYSPAAYAQARVYFESRASFIQFDYKFINASPNTKLNVFVADSPALTSYPEGIPVAIVRPPLDGRAGSTLSDEFDTYRGNFMMPASYLADEMWVVFDLEGEGTVQIDNIVPLSRYYTTSITIHGGVRDDIYCSGLHGDIVGSMRSVTEEDYVAALLFCGLSSQDDGYLYCIDSNFSGDGLITTEDFSMPDFWALGTTNKGGSYNYVPSTATAPLYILGRHYEPGNWMNPADYMGIRIGGLSSAGRQTTAAYGVGNDPLCTRIICDSNRKLYHISALSGGLVESSTGRPIISPGYRIYSQNSNTYVYTGFDINSYDSTRPYNTASPPIQDAAFMPGNNRYVYVVPVVVRPSIGRTYLAAAKLDLQRLDSVRVVQLYELEYPAWGGYSKRYEIDVDREGKVYVLKNTAFKSMVLGARSNALGLGVQKKRALGSKLYVFENNSIMPRDIVCAVDDEAPRMHVSHDGSVYLASIHEDPNATSCFVSKYFIDENGAPNFINTVQVKDMGHITDMVEDPDTGDLWVIGFKLENRMALINKIRQSQSILNYAPAYKSSLVQIRNFDRSPYVSIHPLNNDLALPLSITCTRTGL